jgi:Ala-tRNA(Pro) deacylase
MSADKQLQADVMRELERDPTVDTAHKRPPPRLPRPAGDHRRPLPWRFRSVGRHNAAVAADDLTRELANRQIGYELIPHRPTMTAGEEAAALGVPRAEVAKTLGLATSDGYLRAVLPASERLDVHKVRDVLGQGKTTRLATEAELADAYPMFELGAVPPFGGRLGDPVLVDRRLAERDTVVIEAGSHSESVRMKAQDLLALTQAELADICAD